MPKAMKTNSGKDWKKERRKKYKDKQTHRYFKRQTNLLARNLFSICGNFFTKYTFGIQIVFESAPYKKCQASDTDTVIVLFDKKITVSIRKQPLTDFILKYECSAVTFRNILILFSGQYLTINEYFQFSGELRDPYLRPSDQCPKPEVQTMSAAKMKLFWNWAYCSNQP